MATVATLYADLGLSAADTQWRVNAWVAVVQDDHVVDFRTREPVDEAARRALLALVRVLVPEVPRGSTDLPEPLPTPWRLTLGGELALDGTTGIGNGGFEAWHPMDTDGDNIGDESVTRSRALRSLGGSTRSCCRRRPKAEAGLLEAGRTAARRPSSGRADRSRRSFRRTRRTW